MLDADFEQAPHISLHVYPENRRDKERAEAFFGVELPTDDFVVAVQKEEMDAGPVKGESRRLTLTYRDAEAR